MVDPNSVPNYQAFSHLPPWLSLVVFGAVVVLNVAVFGLAVYRWISSSRAARRAARRGQGIADGNLTIGEVALQGTVEYARDESLAAKVEIIQKGVERNWTTEDEDSGVVTHHCEHRWDEVNRETAVRPFYLRLESGQRVRVHPPADVVLHDTLERPQPLEKTRRIRIAQLSVGESTHALGMLTRGEDPEGDIETSSNVYRGVASRQGWVLEPARGHMVLSSLPLGFGHRVRAAKFRLAVVGALALSCITAWFFCWIRLATLHGQGANRRRFQRRRRLQHSSGRSDSFEQWSNELPHAQSRTNR